MDNLGIIAIGLSLFAIPVSLFPGALSVLGVIISLFALTLACASALKWEFKYLIASVIIHLFTLFISPDVDALIIKAFQGEYLHLIAQSACWSKIEATEQQREKASEWIKKHPELAHPCEGQPDTTDQDRKALRAWEEKMRQQPPATSINELAKSFDKNPPPPPGCACSPIDTGTGNMSSRSDNFLLSNYFLCFAGTLYGFTFLLIAVGVARWAENRNYIKPHSIRSTWNNLTKRFYFK